MRPLQRDKRGNVIEGLCPVVLCLLVADAHEIDLSQNSLFLRRGIAELALSLEYDRDAAKMVRIAFRYAPIEGAAIEFCSAGALRMEMRVEGGPVLTPEDVGRACRQIEEARASLVASGVEVCGAFLVAVTENPEALAWINRHASALSQKEAPEVAIRMHGQTMVLSREEAACADPVRFLGQCARLVLAHIDGGLAQ